MSYLYSKFSPSELVSIGLAYIIGTIIGGLIGLCVTKFLLR